MQPRDLQSLFDMLESGRLVQQYLAGRDLDSFLEDVQLQDSVLRRLEIIGEAARRLSRETRATLPNIPWRDYVGLRNIVIHQYDSVDFYTIWETLQHDLPLLISAVQPFVPGS